MTTLNQTLECLLDGIGAATGEAIKTEINNLLGMPNVDLQAINSAVAALQALLDSDPSTAGFQTGQNIITQLIALGNRLDALENSTVVATLQTLLGQVQAGLAAEVVARQEADDALQASINTLSAQVDTLSQQLATVSISTGQGCDCAAIAAQITALETSLTNLSGTDAAQAAQIATLQGQVATLSGQLAGVVAAAAAAAADAAAALTTAQGTATAVSALQTAVSALDERENGRHQGHGNRLNDLEAFKAGVEALDCTALVARFRTGISAGLAGA